MKNNEHEIKYLQILKTHYLLRDLEEREFHAFSKNLNLEVWEKRICSIGISRTSHYFHFIVSGRIKLYQIEEVTGREITFFILQKGDAFDMLCLLDGCEHDIYYETLDRVFLFSIPMKQMRLWCKDQPGISRNLMLYLSTQTRILENYVSDVTFTGIAIRLARLILKNINSDSQKLELINDLSHEEIAKLVGSTRAVVNRHLQDLKKEGVISIGRQRIQIKDMEKLQKKLNSKFPL